jgi:hypothetical protein
MNSIFGSACKFPVINNHVCSATSKQLSNTETEYDELNLHNSERGKVQLPLICFHGSYVTT